MLFSPDRGRQQQTAAMTILGYVPHSGLPAPAHRPAGHVVTVQVDGALGDRNDPQDRLDQLALAVALHACHPDDLAALDGKTDITQPRHPGLVHHRDALDLHGGPVGDGRLARLGSGKFRAHHQLGQILGGHVLRLDPGHRPALAEHRDRVCYLQDLVQLVVDEDDGVSLRLELPQVAEQLLHLLGD